MSHTFHVEKAFCYYDKLWGWQAVERNCFGDCVGSSGVYSDKYFYETLSKLLF